MEETQSEKIAEIQAEASVEIAQIQADAEVERAQESARASEAIAESQAGAEKEAAAEVGAALSDALALQNEDEEVKQRVEALSTRIDALDEWIRRHEDQARTQEQVRSSEQSRDERESEHGAAEELASDAEEYEGPALPTTEEPSVVEEPEPVKEARRPEGPPPRPNSHYTRMQRRHGLRR